MSLSHSTHTHTFAHITLLTAERSSENNSGRSLLCFSAGISVGGNLCRVVLCELERTFFFFDVLITDARQSELTVCYKQRKSGLLTPSISATTLLRSIDETLCIRQTDGVSSPCLLELIQFHLKKHSGSERSWAYLSLPKLACFVCVLLVWFRGLKLETTPTVPHCNGLFLYPLTDLVARRQVLVLLAGIPLLTVQ